MAEKAALFRLLESVWTENESVSSRTDDCCVRIYRDAAYTE